MERGGYYFTNIIKLLNNHLHNSYNNYYWLPIIASTIENSNNPLHVWLRKYLYVQATKQQKFIWLNLTYQVLVQ